MGRDLALVEQEFGALIRWCHSESSLVAVA
jgi:hypothetical protein